MACTNCGSAQEDGRFCGNCGASLATDVHSGAATKVGVAPALASVLGAPQHATLLAEAADVLPSTPTGPPAAFGKRGAAIFGAIVALAVVVVVILALTVGSHSSSSVVATPTPTETAMTAHQICGNQLSHEVYIMTSKQQGTDSEMAINGSQDLFWQEGLSLDGQFESDVVSVGQATANDRLAASISSWCSSHNDVPRAGVDSYGVSTYGSNS